MESDSDSRPQETSRLNKCAQSSSAPRTSALDSTSHDFAAEIGTQGVCGRHEAETPFITTENDEEMNSRSYLSQKRLHEVIGLIENHKYAESITLAKWTLTQMKALSLQEEVATVGHRQTIQYYLAKALVKQADPSAEDLDEAEQILRPSINVIQSLQRYMNLELLAEVLLKQEISNLDSAKQFCRDAIRGYQMSFGRNDERTQACISLMVSICSRANDSDVAFWTALLGQVDQRLGDVRNPLTFSPKDSTLSENGLVPMRQRSSRYLFNLEPGFDLYTWQPFVTAGGKLVFPVRPIEKVHRACVVLIDILTSKSMRMPIPRSPSVKKPPFWRTFRHINVQCWYPAGSAKHIAVIHDLGPKNKPFDTPKLWMQYNIELHQTSQDDLVILWEYQKRVPDDFELYWCTISEKFNQLVIEERKWSHLYRFLIFDLSSGRNIITLTYRQEERDGSHWPWPASDYGSSLFLMQPCYRAMNGEHRTDFRIFSLNSKKSPAARQEQLSRQKPGFQIWVMNDHSPGHLTIKKYTNGEYFEDIRKHIRRLETSKADAPVARFVSVLNSKSAIWAFICSNRPFIERVSNALLMTLSSDDSRLVYAESVYGSSEPVQLWMWEVISGSLLVDLKSSDVQLPFNNFSFDSSDRLVGCGPQNNPETGEQRMVVWDVLDEVARLKSHQVQSAESSSV